MDTKAVASALKKGSAVAEADRIGLAVLRDYIECGKSALKFVISGKMGVGKSSLINGLIGKNVAKEAQSPYTITLEIKGYKLEVEVIDRAVAKKVKVLIMDCPGLGDPVKDEEANLTAISEHCQDADLLIYCIDMRGRFTTADASGMMEFNRRVGSGIWKNTLFVLTFANEVFPCQPAGWLQTLTFGYFGTPDDSERKEKFRLLLTEWEEILHKFFRNKVKLPEELISDISLVPAGYRKSPPPDRTDWFTDFWFAALSKLKEDAIPALVGINLHRFRLSSPDAMKSTQKDVENSELPITIVARAPRGIIATGISRGGVALGALIDRILAGPVGLVAASFAGIYGVSGTAGVAIIMNAVRRHAEKAKLKIKAKAAEW